MEIMLSKITHLDIGEQLRLLHRATDSNDAAIKDKIQKVLLSEGADGGQGTSPEVEEARKKKLDEQVDTKIQNAFEKLRNDNLFIWK